MQVNKIKRTCVSVVFGFLFPVIISLATSHRLSAEEKVDHVSDQSLFVDEVSSGEYEKTIINAAKIFIAAHVRSEIVGTFKIAKTKSGHQVSFYSLQKIKDGKREEIPEGFGEVYINAAVTSLKLNMGP